MKRYTPPGTAVPYQGRRRIIRKRDIAAGVLFWAIAIALLTLA